MPPMGSPLGTSDSSSNSANGFTAPPKEALTRIQRTGYILVAASGLIFTTAFAAIAQVTSPDSPGASAPHPSSGPRSQVIPGNPIPGQGTLTIDGAAVAGALPPSTTETTPTTLVQVSPDGKVTTTIVTPPNLPSSSNPGSSGPTSNSPTNSNPGTPTSDPSTPSTPSSPPSSAPSSTPSTPDSPSSSSSAPSSSGSSTPSQTTTGSTTGSTQNGGVGTG